MGNPMRPVQTSIPASLLDGVREIPRLESVHPPAGASFADCGDDGFERPRLERRASVDQTGAVFVDGGPAAAILARIQEHERAFRVARRSLADQASAQEVV